MKLLYVDDDPILREFALLHLAADGAAVSVAADGEEGLAAAARERPDIILLDLKMPRMDGFQVLRALRSEEATRRLPVIVITGSDDETSIDRAFAAGATSFIVKPINWRLLVHQIRYVDRARQTELLLVDQVATVERRERQLLEASRQLAEALRAADAASEAKSQFLATVSHELRTPLNAIIGFSDFMRSEKLGPLGNASYREYSADICRSGTHLLSLVNAVLEFSAGESSKSALDEDEFLVSEVIAEALRAVSQQAEAAGISVAHQSTVEPLVLRGDRRRIRLVLVNLLSNALTYTPAGGHVTIEERLLPDGLSIAIADNGVGIAADDIPKVLQPFGRVDSSHSRTTQGVGMGLPLAKRLVERHGGTLEVNSTLGVGTTVAISFRRAASCLSP